MDRVVQLGDPTGLTAPQVEIIRCPVCDQDCGVTTSTARYLLHLKSKHPDAADVSAFRLPCCPGLCRCPVCQIFCLNHAGVRKHLGKRESCRASLAAAPAVLAAGQADGSYPVHTDVGEVGDNVVAGGGTLMAASEAGGDADVLPVPAALLQVPEASQLNSLESLSELLSAFSSGLYVVYRGWRTPMHRIGLKLMAAVGGQHSAAVENEITAGFLLLPGLLNEAKYSKALSPTRMLARFENLLSSSAPALSRDIIALAREWLPMVLSRQERLRESGARRRAPTTNSVRHRLESLIRERRLASAMAQLDHLQELFDLSENGGDAVERVDLDIDSIRTMIVSLNPESDHHDLFSDDQERMIATAPSLRITPQLAEEVLGKLPVGSAAGPSGWTFGAIRAIFFETGDVAAACDAISVFSNRMLAGQLASPLWLRSRAVFIPKKGNVGWRPLGIGEAWYRYVTRCAVRMEGESVGRQLLPLQLGCGVRGGCEIAGRLGQIILDASSDVVIVSLDMKNAFNTMPRGLMLRGLLKYAPSLSKWFKWAYGRSSPLVLSDGTLGGTSQTGCRQGDPLAALCFCVGLQFVLEDIRQLIEAKQAEVIDPVTAPLAGLYAYMDDTNLYVHKSVVNDVVEGLSIIFANYRMILNPNKSRLLGPAAAELVHPAFQVAEGGLTLVGAPTGTPAFRRHQAGQTVDEASYSLPALRHIELWSAWSLLKFCVTARVGYLARVLEAEFSFDALARFDRLVDEAIFDMAGPDVSISPGKRTLIAALRCLPSGLGGLGITRFAGLAGEQACLLSRSVTYDFLERFCPELTSGVMVSWRPLVLGRSEEPALLEYDQHGEELGGVVLGTGERAFAPDAIDGSIPIEERFASRLALRGGASTTVAEAVEDTRTARQVVKPAVRAIQQRRCHQLIDAIRSDGRIAESMWLQSSCFKGSGRWLAGPGGFFYGAYAFRTSTEYRTAFRMRLLLPIASPDVVQENVVLCNCGMRVDLQLTPYHCLDCSAVQGRFIRRHNAVRDTLYDFVKNQSNPLEYTVLKEPRVLPPVGGPLEPPTEGNSQPPPGGTTTLAAWRQQRANEGFQRADVGRFSALCRQYVDVAVVNPTAISYRGWQDDVAGVSAMTHIPTLGLGADRQGSRISAVSNAVLMRESAKKAEYRAVLGDRVDNEGHFVPFIVEATGRLSGASGRYVTDLLRVSRDRWANAMLVGQIGALLARHNALLALAWERIILSQAQSSQRNFV